MPEEGDVGDSLPIHELEYRLPQCRVVEGRNRLVHPVHRPDARWYLAHMDIGIALYLVDRFRRQCPDDVDLAPLKRRDRRAVVGNDLELDAIEGSGGRIEIIRISRELERVVGVVADEFVGTGSDLA